MIVEGHWELPHCVEKQFAFEWWDNNAGADHSGGVDMSDHEVNLKFYLKSF